jgi:hypothetical protein
MGKRSVFCIARTEVQAEAIVNDLRVAGFAHEDISVLFPDTTGTHDLAHEGASKAPEGMATGGGAGGVLGGALGWLAGIGALPIPGLGPFIAAGPIMAALSGAAVGAAVGGLSGALVGAGIPEYEAKRYEGKIASGNVLLAVHTEGADERTQVKHIFARHHAGDIGTSAEARAA